MKINQKIVKIAEARLISRTVGNVGAKDTGMIYLNKILCGITPEIQKHVIYAKEKVVGIYAMIKNVEKL